jgi:hypothetical protein
VTHVIVLPPMATHTEALCCACEMFKAQPQLLGAINSQARQGFRVSLQNASVYTELWSSAEYLPGVACINRKRGTKPAEESVSIWLFGLVTAATLMLQIIETRIISVTSLYHLAPAPDGIVWFSGQQQGLRDVSIRRPATSRKFHSAAAP